MTEIKEFKRNQKKIKPLEISPDPTALQLQAFIDVYRSSGSHDALLSEPTWLQKMALIQAYRLVDRCERSSTQLRQMTFSTVEEAALFEFRRIRRLSEPFRK